MGIYRCHISDKYIESCEVSRSQKHSVINALNKQSILPLQPQLRSGKDSAKVNYFFQTSTFICTNRKKIFSLLQNVFNNGQKGHILYKPYN